MDLHRYLSFVIDAALAGNRCRFQQQHASSLHVCGCLCQCHTGNLLPDILEIFVDVKLLWPDYLHQLGLARTKASLLLVNELNGLTQLVVHW